MGAVAGRSIELPVWLTGAPEGTLHICLEGDWREATAALISGDDAFLWKLPASLAVGDILLTVLDSSPALVVCVERVDAFHADGPVTSRLVLTQPVPWNRVARRRSLDAARSGPIEDGAAVLHRLKRLIEGPPKVATQADGCGDRSPVVQIAAVLAAHETSTMRCTVCDEPLHPSDAIAHHGHSGVPVDVHVALGSTHLVCAPCHELLHEPSVTTLRRRLRPACPSCQVRDYVVPIAWGMLAGPLEDDEAVAGGCALPSPTPQWFCRNCGTDMLLSATTGSGGGEAVPVPARRRDRPLLNLVDVSRALGRQGAQVDIEDTLSDYAGCDVVLDDVTDEGFEVVVGGLGTRMEYPFTATELRDKLDGLIADLGATREADTSKL